MSDPSIFPAPGRPGLDRGGTAWGLVGVAIVIALSVVGADGLVWFDAALVGSLFGVHLGVTPARKKLAR